MRTLLTSSGITNATIARALADLLGKPIAESNALLIPTALYPFDEGARMAYDAITGTSPAPLAEAGWKSVGVLELSTLPSIDPDIWQPAVRDADAILVCGGDPVFLAGWMHRSGFAELLPTLRPDIVYVGVSAGSIAAAATFVETYTHTPGGADTPLAAEDVVFTGPDGDFHRTLVTARGLGLVDVAVIPHYANPHHPDAAPANAEIWAALIPAPTYAIDNATAISVVDGEVAVVSEGEWTLFQP